MTYTQGSHQFTPDRLTVQSGSLEFPPIIDSKLLRESLRLDSNEGIEGKLKFRIDRDVAEAINDRLTWASRTERFTHEIGSIAEELSVCVMEAGGWTELKRHDNPQGEGRA